MKTKDSVVTGKISKNISSRNLNSRVDLSHPEVNTPFSIGKKLFEAKSTSLHTFEPKVDVNS